MNLSAFYELRLKRTDNFHSGLTNTVGVNDAEISSSVICHLYKTAKKYGSNLFLFFVSIDSTFEQIQINSTSALI